MTNTNEPDLISPDGSSLKFAHRRSVQPVDAVDSRKYTPFWVLSVWFLTRNLVAMSSLASATIGAAADFCSSVSPACALMSNVEAITAPNAEPATASDIRSCAYVASMFAAVVYCTDPFTVSPAATVST